MMTDTGSVISGSADLAGMPRGGPDACWLDRLLQTGRPEYLDRDDADTDLRRGVIAGRGDHCHFLAPIRLTRLHRLRG
jgi:hypothetical protein